jgi:rsbT co-antagonist protein RsbR
MPSKDTVVPRPTRTRIPEIVRQHESALLDDWLQRQKSADTLRPDLVNEKQLREQSREFLAAFRDALERGGLELESPAWSAVHSAVEGIARSRAQQGFSPRETATFVFSLKEPLFHLVRRESASSENLADELWSLTTIIDRLGLSTTEIFQRAREEVIARQQQELLELSTPVVTLWHGVLALPLIGTLDSARTQVVMESLLERISASGCEIAIIDITGVPTVDTLVAQHLLKTVAAARLMGAECIISGIRPQIAQTIVHLGIDLGTVITKATLADAFQIALARTGRRVVATGAPIAAGMQGAPGTPHTSSSVRNGA